MLVLGKALYDFVIERNDNEIRVLLDNEIEFWNHHVLARKPPEPDGSESSQNAVKALLSHFDGKGEELPVTAIIMEQEANLSRYEVLKEQSDALNKEIETIKVDKAKPQGRQPVYGHRILDASK